jgi:hypothetical protein
MSDLTITLVEGAVLKVGDEVMALVPTGKTRRWVRTTIKEVLPPGGGVDRAVIGSRGQFGIMGRYNLKAVKPRRTDRGIR